jgi:lipopolysaccharide biosynthesis glycosyltransferase
MARVTKHAAYCGTRNIYGDMETSAKSLVANSDVGKVHFLIEDSDFPTELPDIIECHDVSGQVFFGPDGANITSGFTWMAMMRSALCHVLPDVDKVLSLDADLVALRDVSRVWDIPLDGCYFAAAHEWHRSTEDAIYTNHGVVLYNLAKMRDGKADEIIAELNANKHTWVDQDVGNLLCQGAIFDMPSEYNSNYWTDKNAPGARIVHFAGMKRAQWIEKPEVMKYRDMPWETALWMHGLHG